MKSAAPSTIDIEPGNLAAVQGGHLLQSRAWGELKHHFGWTARYVQIADAAARILFRRFPGRKFSLFGKPLPLGLSVGYIPKGPTIDWRNTGQCQALFSAIHAEARKHRAIFLKVEPHLQSSDDPIISLLQAESLSHFLSRAGFTPAPTIQPQTSIVIDIQGDEESIMAAMKQKTRYNIRLARRKGVTIRYGTEADISAFHHLSQLTSDRDGFGIHSLDYYQTAYRLFTPDRCALLIAEFNDEPLAALMVFRHGPDAYYFYGASSNTHRNLMPTYLIQWEAIRWARSLGCTRYDLWGIPNATIETLEAEFSHRKEGLWGVYRFKRGFGGQVTNSPGAYDYIYSPLLYKLYEKSRETPFF